MISNSRPFPGVVVEFICAEGDLVFGFAVLRVVVCRGSCEIHEEERIVLIVALKHKNEM